MKNFRSIKWLSVTVGAALIALGAVAIIWPQVIVNGLPVLIGIALLCLGVFELVNGVQHRSVTPLGVPVLLQGIVNVAVGCVFLFNSNVSVVFVGVVLGLWAVVSGIVSLRGAFLRRGTGAFGYSCVDGALKLLVGLLLVFHPFGGIAAWMVVLGIFFVFVGISVVVSALTFGRLLNDFFSDKP